MYPSAFCLQLKLAEQHNVMLCNNSNNIVEGAEMIGMVIIPM